MEPQMQTLKIMRQHLRKKCLLLFFAVATIFGLTACSSDEYSPWEMLSTELTSSFPEQTEAIACEGGTFTMNLNTNSSWTIEAPNWISIDKVSGRGNAIVNVNVSKNEITKRRTGTIVTNFFGSEEEGIAGKEIKEIMVNQQASYETIKIKILNDSLFEHRWFDGRNYKYKYDYGYHFEYEVETSLSDTELESLTHNTATLNLGYGYWNDYYDKYEYMSEAIKISLTKGKHIVRNLDWIKSFYHDVPFLNAEIWFDYYFSGKYIRTKESNVEIIR